MGLLYLRLCFCCAELGPGFVCKRADRLTARLLRQGNYDDHLRAPPRTLATIIKKLFNVSGRYALQTTNYRCADGKVMLCNEGANLPCGKANVSKTLPGATGWCKDNPNSDFIPMVATGHDTIYTWHCTNGHAIADTPVSKVDSRGFFVEYWKAVP